jgi:hypothetical protein
MEFRDIIIPGNCYAGFKGGIREYVENARTSFYFINLRICFTQVL